MLRRIVRSSVLAAALVVAWTFAPAASAGNTAWNVSIGLPGFAISAGQAPYRGGRGPGYVNVGIGFGGWGHGGWGYGGYGYGAHSGWGGHHRPFYAPPVAPAPVYAAPIAYPAPYGYAAPYAYAPRVAYAAAVAPVVAYAPPVAYVPLVVAVPYRAPVYVVRRATAPAPVLAPPVARPVARTYAAGHY